MQISRGRLKAKNQFTAVQKATRDTSSFAYFEHVNELPQPLLLLL